ncbi:hypothetical protein ACEPAI_4770 [Sanghuangporus weigelae]
MSTVTPTLIPRLPAIPLFLPKMPTPHPTPLPPRAPDGGGMHARRNLRVEMEELSEEEEEVETQWKEAVQSRGFAHLRVIGRLLTRQEEKNDQAESESDESASAHSGDQMSAANDGENISEPEQDQLEETEDQEQDLDASMEDLDEEGRNNETFDGDEDGEDGDADEDVEL